MIVCQCKEVSEDVVRRTVRAGARTIGEIGFACLAGAECGACHETLEQILQSELREQEQPAEERRSSPAPSR